MDNSHSVHYNIEDRRVKSNQLCKRFKKFVDIKKANFMKFLLLFLSAVLLVSCSEQPGRFKRPHNIDGEAQNLFQIIDSYESVEFFSLEPDIDRTKENTFYGFPILDKKKIAENKDIETLIKYLYKSMNGSEDGIADCFWPRHGLRIKSKNDEIDLVICFQCSHMKLYGKEETSIAINGDKKVFDQVATKLKMALTNN